MAEITAKLVKELRDRTGSGMMDSKKALVETNGDIEAAEIWLRENGILKAAKKSSRVAAEGVIDAYIHAGGKVGVLVEVNSETDFVAKNESFLDFVHNVTLQIAAMNPKWVSREEVPAEVLEQEREITRAEALNEGKPEKVVDKIVEGRLEKFYATNCLLEQAYVKDEDKTIQDLLTEKIAEIGENIVIRRFTRYQLGEGIEKEEVDFAAEVAQQLGNK
ncbi:translation elongation factor Ts [Fastidiosipila sanguinis]|uniref:Elongation factor Ts n=1 Tax=Fastidiosipila sanguinis TaxID=236753 RepID=A0A2S0KMD4_9FIRM|nr:translation elongation factor Ts [Fastidiosipila sanguinis]AVM42183.1 elongation factor Ts [Fastidiosipila sanguinis]